MAENVIFSGFYRANKETEHLNSLLKDILYVYLVSELGKLKINNTVYKQILYQ